MSMPTAAGGGQKRSKGETALRLHRLCRGKIQTVPKCPIRGLEDLAVWYTPGVAAASRAIAAEPDRVLELTNRGNSVAVLTDGSRVLGLGDIGPEAALPVMEGKALLFKYFGGVDAIPLCIAAQAEAEIVALTKALAPSFGGINLEDICAPKCFRILDALRAELPIPVWHDDQQGTAIVVLAGLINALEVVGKRLADVQIALVGIGAANMSVYRLLIAEGTKPQQIIACDSKGTLHNAREDLKAASERYREKWQVCCETNPDRITGGISEALRGVDVCLAFSRPGPDIIPAQAIKEMARDAIVFACANPVPEIWPDEAQAAGARIIATGRSDFKNQVNNSLVFPGVFRGVLDVQANAITDSMVRTAAYALARCAKDRGLSEDAILPRTDDMEVAASVAAAVGEQAQRDGVARLRASRDALFRDAMERIRGAREASRLLLEAGLIPRLTD